MANICFDWLDSFYGQHFGIILTCYFLETLFSRSEENSNVNVWEFVFWSNYICDKSLDILFYDIFVQGLCLSWPYQIFCGYAMSMGEFIPHAVSYGVSGYYMLLNPTVYRMFFSHFGVTSLQFSYIAWEVFFKPCVWQQKNETS